MDLRRTLICCSIEVVGGTLFLTSLVLLALDDEPVFTDIPEIALPAVVGGSIIIFGRWLQRYESSRFGTRQRGLTALGHLAGGVLIGVLSGWILLIVGLESGFPDEIAHILLNGAAIGMASGGVLVAAYLQVRQQQEALEAQTAQLQERNVQLEKLTSIVSHDLRNPLNVAQARLELAEEAGDPEQFAAIARSLDRMETIIGDMLSLTRQVDDITETAPTSLDIVAHSAWQTVETGNVALQIEQSMRIEADEDRLVQAFENLFRNAIEHGGESLTTIRVGSLDSRGFYVEDDGVGIPDSDCEAVFEWGMTTETGGTGLGLGIVNEIIEAHGWSIEVTESSTGGARFEIRGIETV